MAFTLNQIIALTDSYVAAHKQLNTFQFGNPWEFAESEEVLYPALYMVNGNIAIDGNTLYHTFNLLICDRIDYNMDNPADKNAQENEVLSDMREVSLDILALFNNPANRENFYLEQTATLEPFTERFKDWTAGWNVTIRLKQSMSYNRCQVPL
jgi:hypothetical protein